MDSIIELIIGLIVVIFSVLHDRTKKTSPTEEEDITDLTAVEDFFKKQSENQGAPPPPPPPLSAPPIQRAGPQNWEPFDEPAFEEMSEKIPSLPPEVTPPPQKIKQKKEKKKPKIAGQPPQPNLENAALGTLLTGQRSVRLLEASGGRRVRSTNFAWTKRRVLDAFIFNELMTRYDLNRIFERIPTRRSDS